MIPVYIDTSQLQESIDFEASFAQGKMVMASGLLGDTSNRCWVVDDAHVLSPEVRHALLVEAKRRQILLILTINHEDRTLNDVEWELVDVHVSMDVPTLQSKVKVLQRRRDEIEPSSEDLLSLIDSKQVQSIVVPDAMLSLAISYALQARTVGHGAEYVLLQVMKSLAVIDGSLLLQAISCGTSRSLCTASSHEAHGIHLNLRPHKERYLIVQVTKTSHRKILKQQQMIRM